MNAQEYREQYLASDGWKERRREALRRAGYRCQHPQCRLFALRDYSDEDLAWMESEVLHPHAYRLEVHHLSYKRLGRERPEDLIVLCPQCHRFMHMLEYVEEPFSKDIAIALIGAFQQIERAFNGA